MNKSYRIHTNVSNDTILEVNMKQDFDFLEVLSLKLRQKDAYRLHSSNYGVIIGRVLANDAFGIPNAKVSVFIERDRNDSTEIESIYPYSEVTSKDSLGRRYNLLPDYSDDDCYKVVGTFPNKRLLLDEGIYLDIYEKYWKYTTVTNQAGDYMIFGVPTGSVTVHVDIDLSDIGILSQKPRDFEYKGYNISMFDTPNQFKDSTNLDSLAQIFSQNNGVFVYPFWGDNDNGIAAITRSDIQIQYKFEPTCVFIGSIVSDNDGHSIGHKCAPDVDNGMNNQLIGGNGTIEMIRKTVDGLVEEYPIQGNQLIDENGVWCYQIPMNLDYIGTDEYGNIVPTDNSNKGIPTRTQVRFRFSKSETNEEGFSRHTAKYLVPMNPMFDESKVIPTINYKGSDVEKMYNFGSSTLDSCFRDLYWNNVYSVKNYIPKTQVAHRAYAKNYSALKGANLTDDQNPVPFNKIRVDLPFTFMIICILFTIIMVILSFINTLVCLIDSIINIFYRIKNFSFKVFRWRVKPFGWMPVPDFIGCIPLSAGLTEGNTAYYPGCWCKSTGLKHASCPEDFEGDCKKVNDNSTLKDKIQQNLALDFKIIKLDLYQDWINGCLYMPLWYWRKRKKKTFLFGLFRSKAKNEYCSCDRLYSRLKTYVTCSLHYINNSLGTNKTTMPSNESRWHKNKRDQVRYKRGLIKPVENKDGLVVYYYVGLQATSDAKNPDLEMAKRDANFPAIRLYATDIILLGNLDPNNIYGVPQFFKCLPSTTANIPAIATIEETLNPEEEEKDNDKDVTDSAEDKGTTVTTGMDWGHDGNKETPQYKTGLFMDLACTYAATKAKSCVNVERLSEFGVNLDMSYNAAYNVDGSNDVQYGLMDTDGFINKLELDDMENRAMFATLNHIGFIPQSYQDSISGYTTQVNDDNTNYLIPKFKYIYPVDFDGRLTPQMNDYGKSFQQALSDEADESYITFRLGAEKDEKIENNIDGRNRHFYIKKSNSDYAMPLYNNSYYFYFGIKKGNTAIDKFNKMFYAECFKKSKSPFTLDISKKGLSYCPSAYNGNKGYAWIMVSSDDIKLPYSYRLYDSFNTLLIEEGNMMASSFVIGGTINGKNEVVINDDGLVKHQIPNSNGVYETLVIGGENYYLTNQAYTLEVIDSEGKVISTVVKLEMSKINVDYEGVKLGTKWYDSATTRIDYICNDDNKFYGIIRINGFSIDGYEFDAVSTGLTGSYDTSGTDTYNVTISGKNSDDIFVNNIAQINISLNALDKEDGYETHHCLCDSGNPLHTDAMNINGTVAKYWLKFIEQITDADTQEVLQRSRVEIYVYKPSKFSIKATQICDGKLSDDNSSTELIEIQNGDVFSAYLNDMPVRFMIGTLNDSTAATIANTSKMYASTAVTAATGGNISGWFGLHKESSYMFNTPYNEVTEQNQSLWEDTVQNVNTSVLMSEAKRTILKFKFESMFSLSKDAYVTRDSSLTFTMTATGGVSPLLYRNVIPKYEDISNLSTYILSDSWQSTCEESVPNIVGNNYFGVSTSPSFNPLYGSDSGYVGNYFAVFTHNGSYVTNTSITNSVNIMRIPSYASISPLQSNALKRMGRDESGKINDKFKLAHTTGTQNLPNDISRRVQPYLRALYLDRRLDHDFVIMAPVTTSSFSIYDNSDAKMNRIWKSGRLSGFTYNGIEMSYDSDYNVISANTPQIDSSGTRYSACSENHRLEYSYSYRDSISGATTKYNDVNNVNCVWGEGNVVSYKNNTFGFNSSRDGSTSQLLKAFYESTICNLDIRHIYWSNFNRDRLNKYVTGNTNNQQIDGKGISGITNQDNPYYVYSYPYSDTSLYNGDFDKDNYPTKRFIDVGNLPITYSYEYLTQCCSYSINVSNNDDGTITSEMSEGEELNIMLDFGKPITLIPFTSEDGEESTNIKYDVKSGPDVQGRVTVSVKRVRLKFKFNEFSVENFDVYTKTPRIIKVLPYQNGIDGIGYIKTANPRSEFGNTWGDGKSLDDAINTVTKVEFLKTGSNPFAEFFGYDYDSYVTLPEDVVIDDGYKTKNGKVVDGKFFKEDEGDFIASDDERFNNIVFNAEIYKMNELGMKVFSILVDREYQCQESDYLTRHLRTLEFSEMIDCRDVIVSLSGGVVENSAQTLVFLTWVNTDTAITIDNRQCKAFNDYDKMSYTFKFRNKDGEVFNVSPSAISATTSGSYEQIIFVVKWQSEMGLLSDNTWVNGIGDTVNFRLDAKTNSGFIYGVGLKMKYEGQEGNITKVKLTT